MTKKQQAQQIFNDLWSNGHRDRRMIITRFMDVLDMTKAGASTYYATCRKNATEDVATFTMPEVKPNNSILDDLPAWRQETIDKHNAVCQKAQQIFGVDLSKVAIRFDLRGMAAGQACRNYHTYSIRYNCEALKLDKDHVLNDTIPHEIAHIVCMMNPTLGNNHDKGWKRVCRTLGGSGERCHSIGLTSTKKRYRFEYNVDGEQVLVGPKQHSKIQNGATRYSTKRTKNRVLRQHFIKKVSI